MALTRKQVEHVAELAKLKLTDKELDLYQEQLSAILDYAARLDELDTAAIPPTASVLPLRSVMRTDEVKPSFEREAMLENAPAAQDGCVRVRVILEESN
ncbi:MAG: Asp-tRNA(Asn)/Glu-tRNA(Gln) amidotransferase subunit GatC [Anaerolineae bacterium]|nr:Asp-tRNA(Asn)/Glu-tRNA(Gln) amidotransferase subunit GatC [Anaerolineae bacterium]